MSRAWILGLLLVVGGCGVAALETGAGYRPIPLNASESERRAYYAAPYTPEARGAEERRMTTLERGYGINRGVAE